MRSIEWKTLSENNSDKIYKTIGCSDWLGEGFRVLFISIFKFNLATFWHIYE